MQGAWLFIVVSYNLSGKSLGVKPKKPRGHLEL